MKVYCSHYIPLCQTKVQEDAETPSHQKSTCLAGYGAFSLKGFPKSCTCSLLQHRILDYKMHVVLQASKHMSYITVLHADHEIQQQIDCQSFSQVQRMKVVSILPRCRVFTPSPGPTKITCLQYPQCYRRSSWCKDTYAKKLNIRSTNAALCRCQLSIS